MRAAIIGIAMALASTIAVAEPDAMNKMIDRADFMLPICKAWINGRGLEHDFHGEAFMKGFCAGLIEGMGNVATVMGFICPPSDVTRKQSTIVVIAYIEARPQRGHEPFQLLAIEALR